MFFVKFFDMRMYETSSIRIDTQFLRIFHRLNCFLPQNMKEKNVYSKTDCAWRVLQYLINEIFKPLDNKVYIFYYNNKESSSSIGINIVGTSGKKKKTMTFQTLHRHYYRRYCFTGMILFE